MKLVCCVDDTLYISNSEETRLDFESTQKKKFNLTLMGLANGIWE